jgi:ribulose-5-phosphate 4-epimerase/fuculose-1-phosphate aldolase
VTHPGLANLRQYPAMLRHGVRAIPAGQEHDRDPFKRFGNRGVVLEIAVYYLDTFWRLKWGRVTNKGADLATGTKIDMHGNPLGRSEHPVNPAGFTIHSAVHMAREDARAVMHLHTPHGQAVSAMEWGLLRNTQTAMVVAHDVAYHDYEGIATDLGERERLVADLGSKNAMILRTHGTLAVGETVGACFLRLYFLERACEAQVLMLSAGRENLNNPPQGTPEKVEQQANPKGVAKVATTLAWPALLRKLDRIDPSYRT